MDGKNKSGGCNHWGDGWLKYKKEMPEKGGHIEIYNFLDTYNISEVMPAVMLHEMAHAYH